MTDFNMGFQGLSGRAQKFITEKIDDGDGKINAAERNKIAEYLSGKQELSTEYAGIKEELEQFGRNFDVQAAREQLFEDEAFSVEMRGMSDKDMNKIDSITDYNTMKAIAEGKLEGYTPLQQAYAKALLENSQYAREQMLKTENTDLKTQNQQLIEENESLKAELAKISSKSENAKEEQKVTQEAKSALDSMREKTWDMLKSKLNGPIAKIESANNTIIDTCSKIEDFKVNGSNPATIEKSVKTAINIIEQKQNEIKQAKKEGQQILNQELAKESSNSVDRTTLTPIQKLFTAGARAAGAKAAHIH